MNTARIGPIRCRGECCLALLCLLALPALGGCGKVSARDLKLDPDLARESLLTFLQAWKEGQPAGSLKEASPAIWGTDDAWQRGAKLADFRVDEKGFNDGTNLHLTAELVLDPGRGRPRKTRVIYVVGTSPVITVFRQ